MVEWVKRVKDQVVQAGTAVSIAVAGATGVAPQQADAGGLDFLTNVIREKAGQAARDAGFPVPQQGGADQTPQAPAGGKPPISIPMPVSGGECPSNATDTYFDAFQEACRGQIQLPKGKILVLDAREVLQRARADMLAMENVEKGKTQSALACLKGVTSRTDPRVAKCVQDSDRKGDSEYLQGIYAAKTIIRPDRIVETARAVLGENESGRKTAIQVRSGVRTMKAALLNDGPFSPEDDHMGWVTLVDTSTTKLPPGTTLTKYDDYVKNLKAMVQKYPEEQSTVIMHQGFSDNNKGAPPSETIGRRNIFGGSTSSAGGQGR